MHNLPKTGNVHLLAALGLFAIEATAAGIRSIEDRKRHRELLADYQKLNGLSDEAMRAYRPSLADLAEPGPVDLRSPLRTRLTTPERDAAYHLASRLSGNLPLLEDGHRKMFRQMLRDVAFYCGVEVLNFTILDNHFHLLIRVPRRGSRDLLSHQELLGKIRVLHSDLAQMLTEALFPEEKEREGRMKMPGSALEHFGFRMIQGKAELASPADTAAEWAERELERHRGLMSELEMFVRLLKQRFSKWYNATNDRFGTLWTDRFRSILLEDRPEVLQAISAYIDLNAVRRGWTEEPADYPHCGLAEAVRGEKLAQEGMAAILSEPDDLENQAWADAWAPLLEKHRCLLWGDSGELSPGAPRRQGLAAFFLQKHPVLLEGLALGRPRFAENVFRSNRGAFGANGTWRGDQLILGSGLTQRWVVAGLCVLRNVRFDLRDAQMPRRTRNGAFQN
jgi:hypothetical protein